jgi:hypothetical protein
MRWFVARRRLDPGAEVPGIDPFVALNTTRVTLLALR